MSDAKDAIKATGKEFDRNAVSKKCSKIFGGHKLRRAVKEAKHSDKRSSRQLTLDVSDAAEAALGSVRGDLVRSCKPLGLTPPLLDQFQVSSQIEVTTGTVVWELIDDNRFWEAAQLEAVASCRDKIAPNYLTRIADEAKDLRSQLNNYGLVMQGTALPDDIKANVQSDLDEFVAQVSVLSQKMKRDIEVRAGQNLVEFIKKQLKIEKDIFKYRASKSAIVFINAGLLAGHIAHMAASFGGTAPLGIIACVRIVVETGQIAVKAMKDLEAIGKDLQNNINFVSKYWGAKLGEVGTKEKLLANTNETLSGILAGVTNWDTPSVVTIKKLMNDYQHKLNVLTKSYNDLGAELGRLQKYMEAYTAILNKHSPRLTPEQKSKVNRMIDGAITTYGEMFDKAMGGGGKAERIKGAHDNIKQWQVAVAALDNVTSKFTKWVPVVTKVVTSAAMGLGHIGGELAHLVQELADKSTELADLVDAHAAAELISAAQEHVLELGTEIASTQLKLIGEAIVTIVADAGLMNLFEELGDVSE